MKIEEVQQRAKAIGVMGTSRKNKSQLINAIQLIEGNRDCFVSKIHIEAWQEIFNCGQMDCCWRDCCRCACEFDKKCKNAKCDCKVRKV